MHFFIEHNYGHHLHVATPEDGATAKYNQSVYSFWFTSVTKQYIDAWKRQLLLLKKIIKVFFNKKRCFLVPLNSTYVFAIYIFDIFI